MAANGFAPPERDETMILILRAERAQQAMQLRTWAIEWERVGPKFWNTVTPNHMRHLAQLLETMS